MAFEYHLLSLLLYGTAVLLWYPRTALWKGSLGAALFAGFCLHQMTPVGLFFLSALVFSVIVFKKYSIFAGMLATTGLGVALGAHVLPGFEGYVAIDTLRFTVDALPYRLVVSLDKTIAGFLILGLTHDLITTWNELALMLRRISLPLIATVSVTITLAWQMQYVRLALKCPDVWLTWCCINLLVVCVAEEAFFRGFLQRVFMSYGASIKYSGVIAVMITAILFGLAHYAGGWRYMVLAGTAGLGYGWVYYKTQRIEASILTHFTLNAVHFFCFTYPALM